MTAPTGEPMVLEREQYFELQALVFKFEIARRDLLAAQVAFEAAQAAAQTKAASLGIHAAFDFDDATCSVRMK